MLYFCSNMNRFCDFSSEKSKLTRIGKEEFGATDAGCIPGTTGREMLLSPLLVADS